ncbi:MAG: flavodoxin family protein [Anaerolineae bacterium]|nr:flavodoxin family protein [Anaerolineae bacterium]
MKPKVVGLVGSPRKEMNVDTLVQRFLEGCEKGGAAVEKVYLNDLFIQPCQACKVQDGTGCVLSDGMDFIYELLETVDGMVLGTPVYYNTVSSQMKLMIDRCYCCAAAMFPSLATVTYQSAVIKKKKGVVISVGGSGENPGIVMPVFEIWAPEVNLEIVSSILVSEKQINEPPMYSDALLQRVFDEGKAFPAVL